MNPVVILDVSKGESQVQAFLDKGKPYRKSFSIKHDLNGLGSLLEYLKRCGKGSWWLPTFGCFRINGALS